MNQPTIRLIHTDDNQAVKKLVLDTLAEFGLVGEGYAGVDPEMDYMFAAYDNDLSAYYVIEVAGKIEGACGFAPLAGTTAGTVAELRKMYLSETLRGQGWGQKMLNLCMNGARDKKFDSLYLETVPEMKLAQNLYLKNGFNYLEERLGNSGHSKCHVCMQRLLNE